MTLEFVRSEPGDDPIIVGSYFAATPVRVFQAWTDPNIVTKWFGRVPNFLHSATIDLRPGGAWQFIESKDEEKSIGFEGAYLTIEPNARLVFTWSQVIIHATGERESTPYSQVEIVFTPKGNGTEIRLVHSAIQSEDIGRRVGGGWESAFKTMSALLSPEICSDRRRKENFGLL